MKDVNEQIHISNQTVCKLIDRFGTNERGFLSQNILSHLRTLVEAISVKLAGKTEYDYNIFKQIAKPYISSKGNLSFLARFHNFLQQTVSHYSENEEKSERLFLKYYEYLLKLKVFLEKNYNLIILENLSKFPLKVDSSTKEYYKKIVQKIKEQKSTGRKSTNTDRYYIRKMKPFFVDEEIFYEVTFTPAIDNASKFDRIIAFTKHEPLVNYAVKLTIRNEVIEVLNRKMPIKLIDYWETSIRPCELNHFADIFGSHHNITTGSIEYRNLMAYLTKTGLNLVEVIDLGDQYYLEFRNEVQSKSSSVQFLNILDKSREICNQNAGGSNVIRYLLYIMNNKILKLQYSTQPCSKLSDLYLQWGCIPFDEMPFCTSLISHNPQIRDLINCIDPTNRKHELFARFIKNNTEQKGKLYTRIEDITTFNNIETLIKSYNGNLYYKHPHRNLEIYKNQIYLRGYEEDTLNIIYILRTKSSVGIKNYSNAIEAWLKSDKHDVNCEEKKSILRMIFSNSHVALIYGSAGTGKTKLISHISNFHKDKDKLFLANTNPAIDNLRRRVSSGKSTFSTVASFLSKTTTDTKYDILVVDECSTISNSDMLAILNKAKFTLLLLVGDVFQIESILFGNWFAIAKAFLPETSIFELTIPYRTNNENLIQLWNKVRNLEDNILEHLVKNDYTTNLDESLFDSFEEDEVVLCLNYDGLFGINNINNFLQGNNPGNSVHWGVHTYKINDPVLFIDSNRYKPLIHNNLKGIIKNVEIIKDSIFFSIEIDKSISEFDTIEYDLELLDEITPGKSVIKFSINKQINTDEDDDSINTIVPFQVAYAISMHKAQGLEYNSVKIVITDEIEEVITHNLFYTAITRARNSLRIYWTPDTEKKIINTMEKKFNNVDVHLLRTKFGL